MPWKNKEARKEYFRRYSKRPEVKIKQKAYREKTKEARRQYALEYRDKTIKRAEMVILREDVPIIYLEAKYYYSFDKAFEKESELDRIRSDIDKLKRERA